MSGISELPLVSLSSKLLSSLVNLSMRSRGAVSNTRFAPSYFCVEMLYARLTPLSSRMTSSHFEGSPSTDDAQKTTVMPAFWGGSSRNFDTGSPAMMDTSVTKIT